MIEWAGEDPDTSGLAMSVMNERLQRLIRPADRPSVTLRVLALDGLGSVRSELSAIFRFGPGSDAACPDAAGTGDLRNEISPGGGKATYLHRITCQMPATALLGQHRRKELTPKTTESHWSGGQREP
jgi:hypothetical protein